MFKATIKCLLLRKKLMCLLDLVGNEDTLVFLVLERFMNEHTTLRKNTEKYSGTSKSFKNLSEH